MNRQEERLAAAAGAPEKSERGATMVEYCLMCIFIAVVCVLAVTAIGAATNTNFSPPELLNALL